jgi:uncharacterized protein DUF1572
MINLSEIAESYYRDLSRLQQEIDSFPDDAALWRVLPGVQNSAGNLVLHLEGNLREYIGRALGGIPFQRVREAEFTRTGMSQHELHAILDDLRKMVPSVIGNLRADSLGETQALQLSGKQVSTFQYLLLLYGHLSYHMGQIDYLRRISGGGSAIAFVELR